MKIGRKKAYILICIILLMMGIIVSIYANQSIRSVDFYGHTYKI